MNGMACLTMHGGGRFGARVTIAFYAPTANNSG
jgi:hypothetical protein